MARNERPKGYRYRHDVEAGCHTCDGAPTFVARWTGKNAQGVAARHSAIYDHETWVSISLAITYKGSRNDKQTEQP